MFADKPAYLCAMNRGPILGVNIAQNRGSTIFGAETYAKPRPRRFSDGTRAAFQIKAFHDTWHWDQVAAAAYEDFTVNAPDQASLALQAFRTLLGCNDMLAYLSMMAPRLVELHRVLKPTGSIYLHCDPTASHYLKVILDSIFGKENFRNEIVWKRVHTVKSNFG